MTDGADGQGAVGQLKQPQQRETGCTRRQQVPTLLPEIGVNQHSPALQSYSNYLLDIRGKFLVL